MTVRLAYIEHPGDYGHVLFERIVSAREITAEQILGRARCGRICEWGGCLNIGDPLNGNEKWMTTGPLEDGKTYLLDNSHDSARTKRFMSARGRLD